MACPCVQVAGDAASISRRLFDLEDQLGEREAQLRAAKQEVETEKQRRRQV